MNEYTPLDAKTLDSREEMFRIGESHGQGSAWIMAADTVCRLRESQAEVERLEESNETLRNEITAIFDIPGVLELVENDE